MITFIRIFIPLMARLKNVAVSLSFFCTFFFISVTQGHAYSKEEEECRIKATIAQDTNVIYDVDLTPQKEALIVGPEYYNLSQAQKEDVAQAYNCLLKGKGQNLKQECFDFSLKDYKTNLQVASFRECQLISE
jgi:hypothetical protein